MSTRRAPCQHFTPFAAIAATTIAATTTTTTTGNVYAVNTDSTNDRLLAPSVLVHGWADDTHLIASKGPQYARDVYVVPLDRTGEIPLPAISGTDDYDVFSVTVSGTGRLTLADSANDETVAGILGDRMFIEETVPTMNTSEGNVYAVHADNEAWKVFTPDGRVIFTRTTRADRDTYLGFLP